MQNHLRGSKLTAFMNLYSSFIFLTEQSEFNFIAHFNSDLLFNQHQRMFVGFIYANDNISLQHKAYLCTQAKYVFEAIAQQHETVGAAIYFE